MSSNELRRGNYLVQTESPPFPFERWSAATRAADQQSGFLYSAPAAELAKPNGSQWRKHLQVSANQLQRLEAEPVEDQLLVFTPMAPGRTLADQLKPGQGLSPAQTCKLGIIVAHSLSALHQHSITHGGVRPDRVWISNSGQVMLLRDPGFDPANQGKSNPSDWLQSWDAPHQFAAPEFGDSDRPSDPSTDIYSLGCLLYRLVTGCDPVNADTWEQAIALHATTIHPELSNALRENAAGDPLRRVIAHAMSKSRKARFASADSLETALRAALPTASESTQTTSSSERPADRPSATVVNQPQPGMPADSTPRRPARSSRRQPKWLVPAISAALVVVLLGLAVMIMRSTPTERPLPTAANGPPKSEPVQSEPVQSERSQSQSGRPTDGAVTTGEPTPTGVQMVNGYRLVSDQRLLYVPAFRSDSPAISLACLPPGPAAIASFRPPTFLNTPQGQALLDGFESELAGSIEAMAARSGVPIDWIERCTIALHPARGGRLESSLAIELATPHRLQVLIDRLGVAESRTPEGLTIHTSDDPEADSFFFVADEAQSVSRYALGSVEMMTEVADVGGGPINLPRSLNSLWRHASRESDFAAICAPNFLFADGRSLLQSSIPQMIDPLKSLLIPDVSSALLVFQLGDAAMYGEVRLLPAGGATQITLQQRLVDQTQSWPEWADQFLLESQPDPSWRLLAARLPLMTRFVADQVRVGTSDGAVVGNLYLPQRIVPQLGVALALALNTAPGPRSATIAQGQTERLTIEQMLERKMSVSFDQESLESAVEIVIDQFRSSLPAGTEPPIVRIIGGDLQKMGITQNQQIRQFTKSEVPLREVLTDLLRQANPDRTADGPADPKQALVWVLAEDPQNPGSEALLVTTRQASAGKYRLPKEFQDRQER